MEAKYQYLGVKPFTNIFTAQYCLDSFKIYMVSNPLFNFSLITPNKNPSKLTPYFFSIKFQKSDDKKWLKSNLSYYNHIKRRIPWELKAPIFSRLPKSKDESFDISYEKEMPSPFNDWCPAYIPVHSNVYYSFGIHKSKKSVPGNALMTVLWVF